MTTDDDIKAPWSLHFDRDGTEDVAVILDADGDELVRSRPFWLPEGDDPVPPTLAAMRLMKAAPGLLAALEAVIDYAENEAFCLEKLKDRAEGEAEAEEAWKAVEAARRVVAEARSVGHAPDPGPDGLHAALAARRQIAEIWGVEDVRLVRPGLTEDQAWEVLQAARRHYDPAVGITWEVLARQADALASGGRS